MKVNRLHSWSISYQEAKILQQKLARRIIKKDNINDIKKICGVDLGIKNKIASACCVVMSFPQLKIIDYSIIKTKITWPYIPGLLSFREIPALIPAFESLSSEPDIIIADGQGIAHPRRLGLASHLGLILDKPTIGCAKSRLTGIFLEPQNKKGAHEYLYDGDEIIGAALRTRADVKPVFVSTGHKVSLKKAISIVLKCCVKYRLAEPIRAAHNGAAGRLF